MPRDERRMTFIVVPHGEGDLSTRSYELSYRRLRIAFGVAVGAALLLLAMFLSWWWMAAQAARVPGLTAEVTELRKDRARVQELARIIARMEAQYDQVRAMLGSQVPLAEQPAGRRRAPARPAPAPTPVPADSAAPRDSAQALLPRDWPLAAAGYVTRGVTTGGAPHPGIDIAVATGSRVLASGAGTVAAAGEDRVYGRYVRIAHADGYETVYGHASRLLVGARERVRPGQVIALSGSTGVSTAPHLHFELRKDGVAVDPRTLVHPPR